MELGKGAHVVYKIRYHLVPAVKYRKVLLKPEVEIPRRLCGGEVSFSRYGTYPLDGKIFLQLEFCQIKKPMKLFLKQRQ